MSIDHANLSRLDLNLLVAFDAWDVEQNAKSRQIVAHGRLAEAHAGRGARHAPFGQECVERDKQVEVQPA